MGEVPQKKEALRTSPHPLEDLFGDMSVERSAARGEPDRSRRADPEADAVLIPGASMSIYIYMYL